MTLKINRARAAGIVTASVLALLAVAIATATPSRRALLSQLERPAIVVGRAHATKVLAHPRFYGIAVDLTPDRARVPNTLSIRLTRNGAGLSGGRVAIAFSMPAMDMRNVLTLDATPTGRGTYAATIPVLGMAGDWQIAVRATRGNSRPLAFSVDARMPR
jgi:hypothetical protein